MCVIERLIQGARHYGGSTSCSTYRPTLLSEPGEGQIYSIHTTPVIRCNSGSDRRDEVGTQLVDNSTQLESSKDHSVEPHNRVKYLQDGVGGILPECSSGRTMHFRGTCSQYQLPQASCSIPSSANIATSMSKVASLLLLENGTAIAYLNRMGGSHSDTLSHLGVEVWRRTLLEHIPGREIVRADQVVTYCSWRPDPTAWASRCTINPMEGVQPVYVFSHLH